MSDIWSLRYHRHEMNAMLTSDRNNRSFWIGQMSTSWLKIGLMLVFFGTGSLYAQVAGNNEPELPVITIHFDGNDNTRIKISNTICHIIPPQFSCFELNSNLNPNELVASSTNPSIIESYANARHINNEVNSIDESSVINRFLSKQTLLLNTYVTTTNEQSASSSSDKINKDEVMVRVKGNRSYAKIKVFVEDSASILSSYYFPYAYSGTTTYDVKLPTINGYYLDTLFPDGTFYVDWRFELGSGDTLEIEEYDPNLPHQGNLLLFRTYNFFIPQDVNTNNNSTYDITLWNDFHINASCYISSLFGGINFGAINANCGSGIIIINSSWYP